MPWTTALHPDLPIVEMTYAGWGPPHEHREAFDRAIALAQDSKIRRVLVDTVRIEGGHSALDLQKIAAHLSTLPGKFDLREAVLVAGDGPNTQNTGYWEDTCTIRGLQVRLFEDRAEALAWLMR